MKGEENPLRAVVLSYVVQKEKGPNFDRAPSELVGIT